MRDIRRLSNPPVLLRPLEQLLVALLENSPLCLILCHVGLTVRGAGATLTYTWKQNGSRS